MSCSRRKHPIANWFCCQSEKQDKRIWHRRMRAMIRVRLCEPDPDLILLPLDNEAGNVWSMGKDGKAPFDPIEHPEWMRK